MQATGAAGQYALPLTELWHVSEEDDFLIVAQILVEAQLPRQSEHQYTFSVLSASKSHREDDAAWPSTM